MLLMQYCARSNKLPFSKVFRKIVLPSQHPWLLGSFGVTEDFRVRLSYSVMPSHLSISCSSGSSARINSSPETRYQIVVAATRDMGIGKDGKLPWNLPSELKFFKELTMTATDPGKMNAVIMGRKTWEAIPLKNRPLPGRLNIVLTRSGYLDIGSAENLIVCESMSTALKILAECPLCLSIEKVFVIGGAQILRDTLNAPGCNAIHITEIESDVECDTFMPKRDLSMFQPWYSSQPVTENNIRYSYVTYVRVRNSALEVCKSNSGLSFDDMSDSDKLEVDKFTFLPRMIFEKHVEFKYLRILEDIIANGNYKVDSTGHGTLLKFGCQMEFNLRKSFPLLTTKKVFWLGVVEELLWSISGSTNAKVRGIYDWDRNVSSGKLDRIGLTGREEGDLGATYGFQWRHFGARYTNMHADYTGQGFDQLLDVIDSIKNSRNDGQIILSAWNPSDLNLIALTPCHMFAQFYVANGELSCQIYQHSAKMGVGVPFDIASYALLTCIIAHVCDLLPGDFIHVIGDAHVYETHIRLLQEQLQRHPKPFPILKINPRKKDIDSFAPSNFKLVGYDPHES